MYLLAPASPFSMYYVQRVILRELSESWSPNLDRIVIRITFVNLLAFQRFKRYLLEIVKFCQKEDFIRKGFLIDYLLIL